MSQRRWLDVGRAAVGLAAAVLFIITAVSYTHLDVYKRQVLDQAYTGLTEKPSVNKDKLQELYDEYFQIENDNYDTDSWNHFQNMLKEAKKVLDNKDACLLYTSWIIFTNCMGRILRVKCLNGWKTPAELTKYCMRSLTSRSLPARPG